MSFEAVTAGLDAVDVLSVGRTTLQKLPLRAKHINRCVRHLVRDVEQYVAELT